MIHSAISYPYATTLSPGEARELVAGVWWIRLPLPASLDHVNVWALEDGDGWAIVDTGLYTQDTLDIWSSLLAGVLNHRPVTRVFVTHMHPDHLGVAGWLTARFDCRLWMSRLEYMNARVLMGDTGREPPSDAINFYRQAGWDETILGNYRSRFGSFGRRIFQLPDSYRRLHDDERITIGSHHWRVVMGAGHSPEHACLYCEELKLLISGDQVLPRISSNVSVFPTEPDADPLSEWLASLDKLKQIVPDDVLVLPAHHDCFFGLHARLTALRQDSERKLDRLRTALREPKRVIDAFVDLFNRPITHPEQIQFATGECVAHLNFLLRRGELQKESAEVVIKYRVV